jgi:hypothetical protein
MSWTVSEPVAEVDTVEVVLEVLKQAAEAHGVHEAEELGGQYDEQWPEWYAAHITRTLAGNGYTIVRSAS